MADLDTLRPEVATALGFIERNLRYGDGTACEGDVEIIRAELLRLAGEVTELRAVCAATYQAAGCYGLPERFKDALSNAATGERIHDVDVDKLCPVDPVEWVERAEKAEDELAALKATIADASCGTVAGYRTDSMGLGCYVHIAGPLAINLIGKRVHLLLEDSPS